MYGTFTYICPKNQPNVGKYTIHGAYGICLGWLRIFIQCLVDSWDVVVDSISGTLVELSRQRCFKHQELNS
jgi:hypothetical protein